MFTTIGVLSALVERSRSGLGQQVDVAMLDCQVALMENAIVRYTSTGEVPGPVGFRHPLSTPHQAFPASDGWIVVANVKDWPLFCGVVGCDELALDERFQTNEGRTRYYADLEPVLFAAFRQRGRSEWLEALMDVCLVGPVNDVAEIVADPQVDARGMLVDLPTWTGGALLVANTPVRLSRTPGGATRGAPAPGADTLEVLAMEAGLSQEEIQQLLSRGLVR